VQKSVFECILEPEALQGLVARLQREIGETAGNVRIYRLCGACLEASIGVGTVKVTVDEQNCVII
jgi:CRISPR-associated endonuclease Cas2